MNPEDKQARTWQMPRAEGIDEEKMQSIMKRIMNCELKIMGMPVPDTGECIQIKYKEVQDD